MKNGAAYIRVSTEEQTEYSPASQRQLILDYARKNEISLDEEHIYCDDGISGRTAEKRPEFMRMIGTAKTKPKPFDVILIWKYSRFARNMEESILYKGLLNKLGITLISITEPLPEGEFASLMERVIEWMDQYYSIRLGGEVRRGMTEAVSRGKPVSIAPIGYRLEEGRLVVDEERAKTVRIIFDEYCAGKGIREIAQELNALDVRTNRGGIWETRTVRDVLRNKTYVGIIHWNPRRKTRRNYDDTDILEAMGSHEHIISDEQFEQVRKMLKAQKTLYGKYSHPLTGRYYMLHGLVKCSSCGATLTHSRSGSLQCHNYARGKCPVSHSVKLERLDCIVIHALEIMFTGTVPAELSKRESVKVNNTAEQRIKDGIERNRRRLERIYSLFEDGTYTRDEFCERRAKAELCIEELENSLRAAVSETTETETEDEFAETHLNILTILKGDADERKKNKALRSVVDRIVFERPNNMVRIFLKPDTTGTGG